MHVNGISSFAAGLLAAALATPAEAFFRMSCPGRLVLERSDPIVNPGALATHVHNIAGGNGFGFSMTYEQARQSQCSSCQIKEDMSNYWTPLLYVKKRNGKYENVPVVGEAQSGNGGMTVYYLQRKGNDAEKLKAFPENFRMVAGDTSRRSYTGGLDQDAVRYACLGVNGPETTGIPNHKCPGGLRAQVFFPSCWDGKNLDSADHKSHMSYPAGKNFDNGPCPDSHPVHLISLFYEVLYDVKMFDSEWNGDQHPFVFSNGDNTGYGFHGDFVNGWDIPTLQKAVDTCNNLSGRVEDCGAVTMFNDNDCHNCRLPSHVNEQVTGELDRLPGCNDPNAGDKGQCQDNAQIGQGETYFTDITVSKGWEYVGCGADDFYSRTMKGKSQSGDDMTVEKCVDFCKTNGFAYAGLEYSRECYCDNSIMPDRAPKPGVLGNCETKCKGDDGEYCGGTGALSIYHDCKGGKCQNAQYGGNNGTANANPGGTQEESTGGNNPPSTNPNPPATNPNPPATNPNPPASNPNPPANNPNPPAGQPPATNPKPPVSSSTSSSASSQPTAAAPPSYGGGNNNNSNQPQPHHGHGHGPGRPRPQPHPAYGAPIKAVDAPKPEPKEGGTCS